MHIQGRPQADNNAQNMEEKEIYHCKSSCGHGNDFLTSYNHSAGKELKEAFK